MIQLVEGKIVRFPQQAIRRRAPFDEERILEILYSTDMGAKGMRSVKAAFPNVTVVQVLAILERREAS